MLGRGRSIGRGDRIATADRILLAAYHGRKTSACIASYMPPTDELERIGRSLPAPQSLRELHGLGFTTIVLQHGRRQINNAVRQSFANAAQGPDGLLQVLLDSPKRTAYRIRDHSM